MLFSSLQSSTGWPNSSELGGELRTLGGRWTSAAFSGDLTARTWHDKSELKFELPILDGKDLALVFRFIAT